VFEFLTGKIARRGPTTLVLEVGGVGYALIVPVGSKFPNSGGARAWTHFVVREDSQTLYGFDSASGRDLFRLLLSVRGVGPAVALALLSGLEAAALVQAILTDDALTLTRVKGVGKKTAEQMLLDLRDKIGRFGGPDGIPGSPAGAATGANARELDAISALSSIGYKEKEATKLVRKVASSNPSLDTEQLIRAALQA
jgi:Holliday junction DNA helicase RuvA